MTLAKQTSDSTSATSSGIDATATIDLRVADAKLVCRQLQAQVQHARQRLEALVSRQYTNATMLETRLGDGIVEAQNQIERERADARRTAAAIMVDAELESRRRLDVARVEAQALLVVARWLRSQGIVPSRGACSLLAELDRDRAANLAEVDEV